MSTALSRPARPQVPAPQQWIFPTPQIWQLNNGLTIWSYHLPGQHVLALDVVIDCPLSVEPRDREGVALLCARVADEGTAAHPGVALSEALEDTGAAYTAHVIHDATMLSLDVPSTRLAEALPLFGEIALTPEFADADVSRHVDLRLSELEQSLANPPAVAGLAARRVQFNDDSRWQRPAGGLADTVAKLQPSDLHAFHDRYWRPERSVLVIAGDLPTNTDELIETVFGSWERGAAVDASSNQMGWRPASGNRTVFLVDRPDAVQAEVRIIGQAPTRVDPRLPWLQVGVDVVGGSFLSRLNSVLREELGYTYGAHMAVSPTRHGGWWTASWSCRTEVTSDALSTALEILSLAEPIDAEEVEDAVHHIVGTAPLHYDTAGGIAQQARALVAAGMGPDYVNQRLATIMQATADDVNAATAQMLQTHNGWLVVVGAAAELEPQLTQAGYRVEALDL